MPASTVYLSRLLGVVLLAAAVVMLADKETVIATVTVLGKSRLILFGLGSGRVLAGAAIVLVHNFWTKGVWPLLVTLCGWIILLRGVAALFLPSEVFTALVASAHVAEFYYVYAAAPLILGAYLSLCGFSATIDRPAPQPPTRSA